MDDFFKESSLYSFGQHQDFLTYFRALSSAGLSFPDIEAHVSSTLLRYKEQESKISLSSKLFPSCPVCGTALLFSQVNNLPGNQVGDIFKSMAFCPHCFYDIYSTDTVEGFLNEFKRS